MIDTTNYGAGNYRAIVIDNPDDNQEALFSPRMWKAFLEERVKKGDRLAKKYWKVWQHVTWWEYPTR